MIRKVAKAALLAIAVSTSALAPAHGQVAPPSNIPPATIVTRGAAITPLGWFVMGSVACAAVSPMIGTVILGRELTIGEAYHTTLGCLRCFRPPPLDRRHRRRRVRRVVSRRAVILIFHPQVRRTLC